MPEATVQKNLHTLSSVVAASVVLIIVISDDECSMGCLC